MFGFDGQKQAKCSQDEEHCDTIKAFHSPAGSPVANQGGSCKLPGGGVPRPGGSWSRPFLGLLTVCTALTLVTAVTWTATAGGRMICNGPCITSAAGGRGGTHGLQAVAAGRSAGRSYTASHAGPFLFIGILSGDGLEERRDAVREAWSDAAQKPPSEVVCKFILSDAERSRETEAEQRLHGDLLFAPLEAGLSRAEAVSYRSILHKTFHVFEYAAQWHPELRFVLKTDDDAWVNVPALLGTLRTLCLSPDCIREALYMGYMLKGSPVIGTTGHKWANEEYINHTGLARYPRYASGGGYVLSGDLVRSLVQTHRQHVPLKFTSAEDVTVGMWLMQHELRQVHSDRFHTIARPCCFLDARRGTATSNGSAGSSGGAQRMSGLDKAGQEAGRVENAGTAEQKAGNTTGRAGRTPAASRAGARALLQGRQAQPVVVPEPVVDPPPLMMPTFESQLCGQTPFLVLHKLEPQRLRIVAERARACQASEHFEQNTDK